MDHTLYTAATEGKVEIIELFDARQLGVQFTPTKNTALHVAAQSGHLECVEEVLRKCPSLLSLRNADGKTALHVAARKGSANIVRVLINCAKQSSGIGAEATTKEMLLRAINVDKDTTLHITVGMPKIRRSLCLGSGLEVPKRRCQLEVVKMLTGEDPEFQHLSNKAKETPLYLATERGYDEMVFDILEFSKNSGPGRNALHAAILSNCSSLLLINTVSAIIMLYTLEC